jgi:hypothetical protein
MPPVTVPARPPGPIPPKPPAVTPSTPLPSPPDFPWVDTGVIVPAGPGQVGTITFVSGSWTADPNRSKYGPMGDPGQPAAPRYYMMENVPCGCLIGIIIDHDIIPAPFVVDTFKSLIGVSHAGRLYLACNDDIYQQYGAGYSDNEGAITVDVEVGLSPP